VDGRDKPGHDEGKKNAVIPGRAQREPGIQS
jgi:hypothetical protein